MDTTSGQRTETQLCCRAGDGGSHHSRHRNRYGVAVNPRTLLTDQQIEQVHWAAAMLPPRLRDNFLASIVNRLRDLPYKPRDADVTETIRFVLSCLNVAVGNAVLAAPNKRSLQ